MFTDPTYLTCCPPPRKPVPVLQTHSVFTSPTALLSGAMWAHSLQPPRSSACLPSNTYLERKTRENITFLSSEFFPNLRRTTFPKLDSNKVVRCVRSCCFHQGQLKPQHDRVVLWLKWNFTSQTPLYVLISILLFHKMYQYYYQYQHKQQWFF